MKISTKIPAATIFLAAIVGTSVSYAGDPLTDSFQQDSQGVPVAITGTITATEATGCSTATTDGLSFDMGNNESGDSWTEESEGGEFKLSRTTGGFIDITCDVGTDTEITFKTNNDFSEDTNADGSQYGSWPVIIVPDFASQQGGPENAQEARLNGYLQNVTCVGTGDSSCVSVEKNLNLSSIQAYNSDGTTEQKINAEIAGQLFASNKAYGEIQPSPRSGEAALYVIYEGASSSSLPVGFPNPPAP